MANIRIKDLPSTATLEADDRVLVDGVTEGTRSIDKDDFLSELAAIVPGYAATSVSSQSIGSSGTKTFTTQAGLAYQAGARVRASDASNPAANWMEGVVTSYSSTTLEFTADKSLGSGTLTDWKINVAGQPGSDGIGTGDVTGPGSATVDRVATFANINGKVIQDGGTLLSALALGATTLTAGAGLTGGGDISTNRTFTVGAGTGITVNADDVQIAAAYQSVGKQTIGIPAGAWKPKTSGGATATTYQDIPVLSFNGTSITRARHVVAMPKGWNEGTISFKCWGVVDTGGSASNVAVWKMAAQAFSHDDAAWTTSDLSTGAQSANMSWTADDDILASAESSAITIAGSPAELDLVLLEFWRDPTDGSDNNTADWLISNVNVYLNTNAANDA